MYNIYVEVTWDNGIDGEDYVYIGETESNASCEVEKAMKNYFGSSTHLLDENAVKTKSGKHYYWLEHCN